MNIGKISQRGGNKQGMNIGKISQREWESTRNEYWEDITERVGKYKE
jgi:hypothetical protein